MFSVNCEIVLPVALLMMEDMWKLKQNFIKTFKNLDFLLSNSFYGLFLSQIQIKL